jgi:hypothetical protein
MWNYTYVHFSAPAEGARNYHAIVTIYTEELSK